MKIGSPVGVKELNEDRKSTERAISMISPLREMTDAMQNDVINPNSRCALISRIIDLYPKHAARLVSSTSNW